MKTKSKFVIHYLSAGCAVSVLLTIGIVFAQTPQPLATPFTVLPTETPPLVVKSARGEVTKVYRIAMISYDTETGMDELQKRLESVGYKPGVNVTYLRRSGGRNGDPHSGAKERMTIAVNEIVAWKPDLILQMNTNAGVALKANPDTAKIPIIGWSTYAVAAGFAKSYKHPGMNFTGFSSSPDISLFYMRLLKETVPNLKRIGHLYNPGYVIADEALAEITAAAALMDVQVKVYPALEHADFEKAIAKMKKDGMQAIHVGAHESFNVFGAEIGALAQKYRLPAVGRNNVTRGGGIATIVGGASWEPVIPKIINVLQGADPGEIPIERGFAPTITLNLKAAKQLGLTIPEALIDDADVLIE